MLHGLSGRPISDAIRNAPWWAYILFLQNLFHLALPPAIGPTWSLAIEEQYYFLWAPVVRLLARPWSLALFLAGALVASPLFRMSHFAWITPTHTLTHIDGIAMGSLLALGLHTLPLAGVSGSRSELPACRSASLPPPPSRAALRFSILR